MVNGGINELLKNYYAIVQEVKVHGWLLSWTGTLLLFL